jgi:hypothetical protein
MDDDAETGGLMARNVNVWIDSEQDGTRRQNVPDYLMHLTITWTDDTGAARSVTKDEYLLLAINWLINNHPRIAKQALQELVLTIARTRYGVDIPEPAA